MPLAARVSIGRGVAAVLGVLAVAAGVLGSAPSTDSDGVPTVAVIAIVGVIAAGAAVVARGGWQERLGPSGQEAVLAVTSSVPVVGVHVAYLLDVPTDPDALLFLAPLSLVAAITLPVRTYRVGGAAALAVVVTTAAVRGGLGDVMLALAAVAATAVLADRVVGVLARTMRDQQEREVEAEVANRALRAVVDAARTATTSDPEQVLEAVAAATANLDSDTAGVYLLHEDGKLRYGATYHVPDHLHGEVFAPTHGLAGQALSSDRTVVTNDYAADVRGMAEYKQVGLRAAVATPVRVDGAPVGVLVVGRYEPGGYSAAEVTAVELLAEHAGHALALSRAIDEDRQLLRRLQSLRALQEDFVATVSHELRTPLTIIDGLAETMEQRRDHLDAAQTTTLLSRLRANTTTLTTIVTSILDAARLDRGLVEVDARPVDLWDLVHSCVGRLAPVLERHRVVLDLDDVVVLGDEALLARVIDNLLTNAERHTPPGTTVTIEARQLGDECTVVLRDDGPGIPPADLHRITERFTRGGELNNRAKHGLGLGLALADQILRLHGARLLVTSPPGAGAHFQFRLRTHDEVTPPG